ncbi:MAG: hypothetical protein LAQ30_14540 [Acidobacteriia bacterium]|nr:hypothetical protein [Terriglobia bacterium]
MDPFTKRALELAVKKEIHRRLQAGEEFSGQDVVRVVMANNAGLAGSVAEQEIAAIAFRVALPGIGRVL